MHGPEPKSQLGSLTSLIPFLPHGSSLQNPSLNDNHLHSVRTLLGCPSVAAFGASWQGTMSTTSSRTWIQATYRQQLTLPTAMHTGARYLSRARAPCPVVTPRLQREESISHGQMFTLQMQQRTESHWGKVLQVTMRAPLDLVHPDYYQQLLRVVCYHPDGQKLIREDSHNPFYQISFWGWKTASGG